MALRVPLHVLVLREIHKDLKYQQGNEYEERHKDRKIRTQTALKGPVDVPPALTPHHPPLKQTEVVVQTVGRMWMRRQTRAVKHQVSVSAHSECQFDIFDQLRKRIKQSFFPPWSLLNVGPTPSCGAHKEPCVAFHCAVNVLQLSDVWSDTDFCSAGKKQQNGSNKMMRALLFPERLSAGGWM